MNNWTLFFSVLGITTAAMQLFRVIDWIERPAAADQRKGGRRA